MHIGLRQIIWRVIHPARPFVPEPPAQQTPLSSQCLGAHRPHQRIGLRITLAVAASKSAATIGIQGYRIPALALPDTHLHHWGCHLPIQVMMHRKDNGALAEHIQNDA